MFGFCDQLDSLRPLFPFISATTEVDWSLSEPVTVPDHTSVKLYVVFVLVIIVFLCQKKYKQHATISKLAKHAHFIIFVSQRSCHSLISITCLRIQNAAPTSIHKAFQIYISCAVLISSRHPMQFKYTGTTARQPYTGEYM